MQVPRTSVPAEGFATVPPSFLASGKRGKRGELLESLCIVRSEKRSRCATIVRREKKFSLSLEPRQLNTTSGSETFQTAQLPG